jgi:hypothetical protein
MFRIQTNEEHLTMDTNPIAQNAARPFGAAAITLRTHSSGRPAVRIALAAAALLATAGLAAAQERYPVGAGHYYGFYDSGRHIFSLSGGDRIHFDHSGTRGRDGLGGSPFHPEGPGNDSD